MGLDDSDEIKRDELGNLIFRDKDGKEIKADPTKFKIKEPLCKICKKDYRTCENEVVKDDYDGGKPPRINGYPDLLYCCYFLE